MTNSSPPLGAIAYGRSGVGGIVTEIDSERVILEFPDGLKRVPLSAIVNWEKPPTINVGSIVSRTAHRYGKKWIPPISKATVERLSPDGYWVRTPAGNLFHVSQTSIEQGWWKLEAIG